MRIINCFTVFLLLTSTKLAFALPLSIEERLSDFEQLNAGIESNYGPLEYKIRRLKINFDKLKADYRKKILQTNSNADFYYLIRQYISEFHDGHFFALVPSEKIAAYPITAERVDNRIFISTVSPNVAFTFPFKKGDEILKMNSVPIKKAVKELAKYQGNGNPKTELRKATWMLFFRPGILLPVPTEKEFTLTIKEKDSGKVTTITRSWVHVGDSIDEDDRLHRNSIFNEAPQLAARPIDYLKLSDKEVYELSMNDEMIERSYKCSGSTRIKIPSDAILLSEKPFVSYIHKTPKGKVGYIRLPHYSPSGHDSRTAINQFFEQYEYIIREMEKSTIGLIIDQDHNCGGYVSLVEKMTSLFIEEPVRPMQFRLRASKAEYLKYRSWMKNFNSSTLFLEGLTDVENTLKNAWQAGNKLTAETSIMGNKWVYPNRIRYTKPVIITIDEMSGSGGDAFPALMKGYKRAKLVGTRTAGMGGHIGQLPNLNYSQISIQLTKSLFYRPDGIEVENNGATPNYPYKIKISDFNNGYQDYQKFYIGKLLKEVK